MLNANQIVSNVHFNRRRTRHQAMESDACSICLTSLSESPVKRLQCSHSFHEQCLTLWEERSNVCPYCRLEINPPEDMINSTLIALLSHVKHATNAAWKLKSVSTSHLATGQNEGVCRELVGALHELSETLSHITMQILPIPLSELQETLQRPSGPTRPTGPNVPRRQTDMSRLEMMENFFTSSLIDEFPNETTLELPVTSEQITELYSNIFNEFLSATRNATATPNSQDRSETPASTTPRVFYQASSILTFPQTHLTTTTEQDINTVFTLVRDVISNSPTHSDTDYQNHGQNATTQPEQHDSRNL